MRYFVSLPTNEAHEKAHPTGIAGGMSQRVHHKISQKIEDLVKEGITDIQEVKRALRFFVKTDMKENLPSESNRAYYPTNTENRYNSSGEYVKSQGDIAKLKNPWLHFS